jgi:cytochrome d ubiquinol oxidase subunit I
VVHGLMRTADAISPVAGNMVFSTLVAYVLIYAIVFSMGIYYINRLINIGPKGKAEAAPKKGMANRPLSGAGEANEEAFGKSGT